MKVLAERLTDHPAPYDPSLTEEENLRRSKEHRQKRNRYYELSLIYGDMEILEIAASILPDSYDPRDSAQVRSTALDELAYWEFAAMRGLQAKKYQRVPWVIKKYNHRLDTPLELTKDDKTYIRQKAQTIYNDLEAKRMALGLGPFKDLEDTKYAYTPPDYDPLQDYLEAMGDHAF